MLLNIRFTFIQSKTVIDNLVLEQIPHFNYLRCDFTYENGEGVITKKHISKISLSITLRMRCRSDFKRL